MKVSQNSLMYHNIEESAIFIADSHFNEKNQELEYLLNKIKNEEINTSQIFLMGDIFDFLSGQSEYFIYKNKKLIDLINELSCKYDIIYLEGNHDYNLEKLFSNVKVHKRESQPIIMKYKDKKVALSHGDIFTPWHYNIYCSIIRNKPLLKFLNFIDINNFLSKKIYYSLIKKNICSKMKNFEVFAKKRLENYKVTLVIEGHFHQGKNFIFENKEYVNVPSLCCQKKYFRIKNNKFIGENI